jgi:hypothetical protein
MYGDGKSDRLIVAERRSNKEDGAPPSAESVEPSSLTKGKALQQSKCRTLSREGGDMVNSKRARSEKSRTQPRAYTYVSPVDLQSALEWLRQGLSIGTIQTILVPNSACALIPEVGAQCGSSARWDLCGGCPERGIPTASFTGQ